jgi:hypothetical protein
MRSRRIESEPSSPLRRSVLTDGSQSLSVGIRLAIIPRHPTKSTAARARGHACRRASSTSGSLLRRDAASLVVDERRRRARTSIEINNSNVLQLEII